VFDIVSVEANEIQPVPRTTQDGATDFLSGLVTVEHGMIALVALPISFRQRMARAAFSPPSRVSLRVAFHAFKKFRREGT